MQFITDTKGHKTGVIISIDEYQEFISTREELEDIKDFDEIMAAEEWVDGEEAKKELGI